MGQGGTKGTGPPVLYVTLRKRDVQDIFGLVLGRRQKKKRSVHYVDHIIEGSLATEVGVQAGHRVIEVNDENVEEKTHEHVVDKIHACATEVTLLLADPWVYSYYRKKKITISGQLPNVIRVTTLANRPTDDLVGDDDIGLTLEEGAVSWRTRDGIKENADNSLMERWTSQLPQVEEYLTSIRFDTHVPIFEALRQAYDGGVVQPADVFECSLCYLSVQPGDGVVLKECLHTFCKRCLSGCVEQAEDMNVCCPFSDDEYQCEAPLLHHEIKEIVSPEVYSIYLERGLRLAEDIIPDSFHCRTQGCPGWCIENPEADDFLCIACGHSNCTRCRAIHEGQSCTEYQDKLEIKALLDNRQAMNCPACTMLVRRSTKDWSQCSMCFTEVCWLTLGPRWGPQGRGDTSGGCHCQRDGLACHSDNS